MHIVERLRREEGVGGCVCVCEYTDTGCVCVNIPILGVYTYEEIVYVWVHWLCTPIRSCLWYVYMHACICIYICIYMYMYVHIYVP